MKLSCIRGMFSSSFLNMFFLINQSIKSNQINCLKIREFRFLHTLEQNNILKEANITERKTKEVKKQFCV